MQSFAAVMVAMALFLIGLDIAHAEPGATGTPYPEGTRVQVTTKDGHLRGVLEKSSAENWIMLREEGAKVSTAIKLGDGVMIRPLTETKEATVRYWNNLALILKELSATKDDRGFWDGKPLGSYFGTNIEGDFPFMSGKKLRSFADKINAMDTEDVNVVAIDAGKAVGDFIMVAAKRDTFFQDAVDGAIGNTQEAFKRADGNRETFIESRANTWKNVVAAKTKLEAIYKVELENLILPHP